MIGIFMHYIYMYIISYDLLVTHILVLYSSKINGKIIVF